MKFSFLVPVNPPSGVIQAGTEMELSAELAALYAGRGFDHLAPIDAEAKALLEALRSGKEYKPPLANATEHPPADVERTRAELLAEAKYLHIKGADGMKKEELIAAISEAKS